MTAVTSTQSKKRPLAHDAMADLLCTIMILCRGSDEDGEDCWAYMCVKPSMAQAFKDARDKGIFDIEEYGTVIESGSGIEPPVEIKRRMERDFGMNHSYEDGLAAAIRKMRNHSKL